MRGAGSGGILQLWRVGAIFSSLAMPFRREDASSQSERKCVTGFLRFHSGRSEGFLVNAKMMKILSLLVVAIFQGCYSLRNSAIPDVNDLGPSVSTRNRYRLSCVYKGETSETMRFKTDFFQRCEPRVFSPGGIPVSLPHVSRLMCFLPACAERESECWTSYGHSITAENAGDSAAATCLI